ncbi:queuosine precursor transporter [Nocardia jiangxiensis]|uniref:Probable queuosine precursor transporter n=1 Tax=Nocardia jiangxiensis TaxID=282685 RepID=A0ABW6RYT8_9NOCA|nr:queuosine precursor transporter [Nocardia jiangxiensis]
MSETRQTPEIDESGRPAAEHASFARAVGSPYTLIVVVFTTTLMISNICATKGVQFFGGQHLSLGPLEILPITTDGAFFLFPLAYVIGDILSEVYGFKAARRTIYYGFGMLALMVLCFWIAIGLPAADFYSNQDAFRTVAGTTPQLVAAGLAGYVIGQFLNSVTLVLIKERTKEKHLWARLLGSTVAGEFGDTLVFCSIAATAIGINTWGAFLNYVLVGFIWKTLCEVIVMPISYRCIAYLKKREPSYAPLDRPALYS